MAEVIWTDVGPRDGLQNLADAAPTEVKVRLVRGLLATGVPRVEATSFVSPKWVPQLADAAEVLDALDRADLARLRVLIPNRRGLELAIENGVSDVLVTIAATDSFNRRNVNRSVAESLDGVTEIVELARPASVTVDVAVSVAFGCPYEGRVDPERVVEVVTWPRLALHVHDTRGMAVANVVAAYEAGLRHFEGSVGGLGGCPFAPRSTGNVCSEDALQALMRMGASTGVDLEAYC
jgi:hydroxymethylglutaryl-CoA lyase